ncbi:DUF692 domain-containing protein [Leptospira langatensis]|uniref:DUF692 domain-containing protein n=1 Tax=Leptospira langatensis TaxID=2484983 RepID=A0A5F1ZXJ1_9LEPT|nr:DUF692 domain-containing protein [Leptospira langatensis]TGK01251.1 DUF692 domain-containing protein [Leptospira langatensis]TGL42297.1 DUF692 domain-containing protein [Leptospira langatensis]
MGHIGIGLRKEHYPYLKQEAPVRVSWFEAITENYMDSKGKPLAMLEKVRENFPVALHGVSLSILGGTFPNPKYFERWRELIDRIQPFLVSDHLCWTEEGGNYLHDLLPFPFTKEFLDFAVERVDRVQEILGRKILLENVSTYLRFEQSEMQEWEFIRELALRSGCGLLLDINNVYVNSMNHGFSAEEYLRSVPWDRVGQIHIAGHTDTGEFLFDTHSRPVAQEVWDLFSRFSSKIKDLPILLEWDDDIPSFQEVEEEALKAEAILSKAAAL